ncbi:unnamed protein product [Spirodela intermedia]|uniref:BZIP domain-containing protein n=1 Tax=Spirodela intermedia TaxID=51605 RepID=A0A7I8JKF8_SPIIN|nr:unnamed protein product [Spirodela intermedia]CAA6670667.1 unnamed protein product [Spirodela intermedia]
MQPRGGGQPGVPPAREREDGDGERGMAMPPFQFSRFFSPPPPVAAAVASSNSDEGDGQQRGLVVEERRRRRMISNRESARRSRMRKQRHLDELQFQVSGLRSVNRRLIDQLNRAIADRDHTLLENSRLRGEVSGLQRSLQDLQAAAAETSATASSATPTPTNSTRRNTKNRTHLPTFFPEQYPLSLSLTLSFSNWEFRPPLEMQRSSDGSCKEQALLMMITTER